MWWLDESQLFWIVFILEFLKSYLFAYSGAYAHRRQGLWVCHALVTGQTEVSGSMNPPAVSCLHLREKLHGTCLAEQRGENKLKTTKKEEARSGGN